MSLTIKNPETVALIRDLAQKTGLTQTAAITQAVRQALVVAKPDNLDVRRGRVESILRQVWADMTPSRVAEIQQSMDALYNDAGLPA